MIQQGGSADRRTADVTPMAEIDGQQAEQRLAEKRHGGDTVAFFVYRAADGTAQGSMLTASRRR